MRRLLVRGPIIRIVSFSEIAGCPALRLDPDHYIPRHRVWECRKMDKPKRRGALVEAWLNGEVGSEELSEIIRIELEGVV